jgi:hypothetical protein
MNIYWHVWKTRYFQKLRPGEISPGR